MPEWIVAVAGVGGARIAGGASAAAAAVAPWRRPLSSAAAAGFGANASSNGSGRVELPFHVYLSVYLREGAQW